MSSTTQSSNWREIISARSTITNKQEYLTSTNGALNINGSFSISGSPIPISNAPTAIVTAIVDSSGNQISSFGGGTQYTDGGTPPTHPIGPTLEFNNGGTWATVSAANPLPVSGSFTPPSLQNVNITEVGGSVIALGQTTGSASLPVVLSSDIALPTGTNHIGSVGQFGTWNITNVSGTISLPTGASTSAKQPALGTAGTASSDVITVQGIAGMTPLKVDASATTQPVSGTVTVQQSTASNLKVDLSGTAANSTAIKVDGSAVTQPISASSLPLPTGAATSVKQPALGTAGIASTDVITVQGIASMTALKVDNSGVTQPVSGTVTANAGTNLNTSALALETGGNLAAIKTDTDTLAGAVTASVVQSNIKQINGVAPSMGNGVSGTGVQRVTLASDSTGQVALASGSTVAVTQATASSLNATVVGTGTFSVQTSAQVPGTGATNLGKAEDAAHASSDTGVFVLGVRNDGAATSFTNANGDYNPIGTDTQGRVYVVQKAGTSTLTNVSTSTTNATLLSSNTARVGAQIYNDATQILYVKFGVTASSTSFTAPLAASTYYEVPAGYTGQIDGVLASGTGTARVTEES